MTSKRNLAAIGALAGLALVALIAAVLDWGVLVVLAFAGMLAVLGVVALNTNTLVRSHRQAFDKIVRSGGFGPASGALTMRPVGAPASQEDLTGALRLLQAQYVGRLDRAQSTFERAAAALTAATSAAPAADPLATLPDGSVLVLHAVTPEAIARASDAVRAGIAVHVVAPDSVAREALAAAGLGALPLALSLGDAATSRMPLGIVIVGGVMFSLFLTLFVIPAIYSYLSSRKQKSALDETRAEIHRGTWLGQRSARERRNGIGSPHRCHRWCPCGCYWLRSRSSAGCCPGGRRLRVYARADLTVLLQRLGWH